MKDWVLTALNVWVTGIILLTIMYFIFMLFGYVMGVDELVIVYMIFSSVTFILWLGVITMAIIMKGSDKLIDKMYDKFR